MFGLATYVPDVSTKLFLQLYFLQLYCLEGISPMGCLPQGKPAAKSNTSQPTVHAVCFGVSIIHRTLTWTKGYLTCAQMLMHAIAHGVF